jgi:hypothetical protein
MKLTFRERARRMVGRKGSFVITINGSKAIIETWGSKGFQIRIAEKGEDKPKVWVYRNEKIAFDRFEEYCGELRR